MSHYAVNWALEQRALRPSAKLVLICLADRHNKDTGHCYPSQARLAEDACVSRSTLNVQLDLLEALGYFTRITEIDPVTRYRRPTQYHLNIGFTPPPAPPGDQAAEDDQSDSPSGEPSDNLPDSLSGNPSDSPNAPASMSEFRTRTNAGAMSEKHPDPCPENADIHVQNLDNNPVRLTRKNNLLRASACEAAEVTASGQPDQEEEEGSSDEISEGMIADLRHALGVDASNAGKWWASKTVRKHIALWLNMGLTAPEIISEATRSRARHPQAPEGPKALDGVMQAAAERKRLNVKDAPASKEQILAFWAEKLNSAAFVAASSIKISTADALITSGLVKPATLRARGIAFSVKAA